MSTADLAADLPELPPIEGRNILAAGCGEGRIARLLAQEGATVIGTEHDSARVAKAQAMPAVAGETYREGPGSAMPVDDAWADGVVWFGTLHHVPHDAYQEAIAETARVLKPGGFAYVTEPLAQGPYFELLKPAEDETPVRAQALAAIRGAHGMGLSESREFTFMRVMRFADFEAFKTMVLTIGPERKDVFAANEATMRQHFADHGVRENGNACFDQPFRVNMLSKG